MDPLPRSPYAAAKLSGELYSLAYARAGLIEGRDARAKSPPRESPGARASVTGLGPLVPPAPPRRPRAIAPLTARTAMAEH